MKIRHFLQKEFLQILLLLLPCALVAAWWNELPPTVVTHWDIAGHPNGWMPKMPGLLIVPLLNVALCALLASISQIDPRLRRDPAAHTARYRRGLRIVRYAIAGFITLVALAITLSAKGWSFDVGRLAFNGILVLFVVTGNFMGTLAPSYLMGIRTPWTLDDAGTWRATHRLTGRCMVFGSLVLLPVQFLASAWTQFILLAIFVVSLGVFSVGFSAWFYRQQRLASH